MIEFTKSTAYLVYNMKKIVPVSSLVVNYLTYIQAYCGINWELEDKQVKSGFLSDTDKKYIQSCSNYLSFGDGSVASLSEIFYFLPAYIFRNDSEGIFEYFSCLEECYNTMNTTPLFENYSIYIHSMQEFNPYFLLDFKTLNQEDVLLNMKHLSTIYKSYFVKYFHQCWIDDLSSIKRTMDYINRLFNDDDIIGRWEAHTQFTLLSDKYEVIIVPSLQSGPRANSLHYGINIFPAISDNCSEKYFDHFISHEVGTHILKPYTIDRINLLEDNLRIYYIAFENLAKHINLKLLPIGYKYELGEEYYHDSVFENIYNNLDTQFSSNVERMYSLAIEEFNRKESAKGI